MRNRPTLSVVTGRFVRSLGADVAFLIVLKTVITGSLAVADEPGLSTGVTTIYALPFAQAFLQAFCKVHNKSVTFNRGGFPLLTRAGPFTVADNIVVSSVAYEN